jgi:hypothetical protein
VVLPVPPFSDRTAMVSAIWRGQVSARPRRSFGCYSVKAVVRGVAPAVTPSR